MSEGHAEDAPGLAREWRQVRSFALEIAATIPETRVYRNTERSGWTLKHELSHLAALDAEVLHMLRAAHNSPPGRDEHVDAIAVRRRRGEAMHRAQDMRLLPLREHLAEQGEEAARAIEGAGDALSSALAAHLRASLASAREGLEAVRGILAK